MGTCSTEGKGGGSEENEIKTSTGTYAWLQSILFIDSTAREQSFVEGKHTVSKSTLRYWAYNSHTVHNLISEYP